MNRPPSDQTLLRLLAGRDEQAAKELFQRYAQGLSELAERHISQRLSARIDGEDVVQSVFRTFFERSARGEFQIDASGDLWCLLVAITLAKVRMKARWHQAAKRDIAMETPAGTPDAVENVLDKEPGPEEALTLMEQVELILKGLPETYAHILSMRLQKMSKTEIANRLGITRQTVHRALEIMQDRMRRMNDELDD
jgi:RNA polymerase sigma-70 factor (ECF subfamily)